MRVIHVIPSVSERSGGPATAIIPMCRALMQHGVEVLLITTNSDLREDELPDGPVAEYKGVPAMFFPSQLGQSFKYSRPLASWLGSNIRHFGVAHIHAVFNHSSVAAAHLCRKAGVPYVVRPLGTLEPWSVKQKSLRKRLFWEVSGKAMLRRAAAVHYTTEAEKLSTEALFGLQHGRVIALGIEPTTSSTTNSLAQHFPLLASDPYVLVLSRLHPKKGLDVLIDAFLSLVQRRQFANCRLVIAGDGPADYVLKLKERVRAQQDRVVFTGWLDGERKDAILAGASLLALPSHQENFGLCVMEALSHSVPVLVSRGVNLAAEIELAKAGWISAIDRDALARSLAEALTDDDERARRGRAGKALSRRYSWDNTAQGLADLYRDLLEEHDLSRKEADRMLDQITPLILTYNEAPNIARTLGGLSWAREIVVVDSFSDDDTREIATSFPRVRFVQRAFDCHRNQWEFGLKETGISTPWVLALDADYVVSKELTAELEQLQPAGDIAGYRANFIYRVKGKELRSGIYPPVTVLYRRAAANYLQDGHTQRVALEGNIETLQSPMFHDDRKSLSHWLKAQTRYTELEAQKLLAANPAELGFADRLRRWRFVLPPVMLVYCLIVRGGILDGWPGFYYAFQRTMAELMLSLRLIREANLLGVRRPGAALASLTLDQDQSGARPPHSKE